MTGPGADSPGNQSSLWLAAGMTAGATVTHLPGSAFCITSELRRGPGASTGNPALGDSLISGETF